MNRSEKLELAQLVKEKAAQASLVIFVDYRGLKASDADLFRKKLRTGNIFAKVIKNNVARKAVQEMSLGGDVSQVVEEIRGPTLMAFAMGDPAAAAKIIYDYSKENEALQLKDGFMGAKRIRVAEIGQLANLPSREVLLSMFLSVLQAPARNFVSVLAALPRSLVTVLAAIRDKKQEKPNS